MALVYVFAASKLEYSPVKRLMRLPDNEPITAGGKTGRIGSNEIVLFAMGVGPSRARKCADSAFQTNSRGLTDHSFPDAAVVIGLCGGVSPSVRESELVLYSENQSTQSSQTLAPSKALTEGLRAVLEQKEIPCKSVVGITTGRVATTREEKKELAASGAHVVDMESYEIVAAANRVRVSVAVLRVVSDGLDRPMPDFNRAMKPNGDVDPRLAAVVCLRRPIVTAKLFAIGRRAMQQLSRALAIVLPADAYALSFRADS
jgi:nucleoside phosphorylase